MLTTCITYWEYIKALHMQFYTLKKYIYLFMYIHVSYMYMKCMHNKHIGHGCRYPNIKHIFITINRLNRDICFQILSKSIESYISSYKMVLQFQICGLLRFYNICIIINNILWPFYCFKKVGHDHMCQ